MKRTVIIVQARVGSTRLPGKVLMDLAGHTVLEHVLTRCAATPGVDEVCCATSVAAQDDPVADLAHRLGHAVFRGSETDVLDRYLGAARATKADVVMRVTSDCPLIDPGICGRTLALLSRENADFATNNAPPSWPHGYDCEAFPFAILEQAAQLGTLPDDREHVTEWMRRTPGLKLVNLDGPGGEVMRYRLTLDYPEDLAMFRALAEYLPALPAIPTYDEVMAALARHPDVAGINAARHHARIIG